MEQQGNGSGGDSARDARVSRGENVADDPEILAAAAALRSNNENQGHPNQNEAQDAASLVAAARQQARRRSRGGAAAAEARRRRALSLTYPQPRNFAERLMGAMQANLAQDCLQWAGDGRAVALHPKNLRRGTILHDHFHIASYGAFIRNFNRWGFKRVARYEVPAGMITYENSLFRRNEPHLVKHMRMDSDVQDIYERQRELASRNVPESIQFAAERQRSEQHETGAGLQPHQQEVIDWLNGNGWSNQGAGPQLPPLFDLQQLRIPTQETQRAQLLPHPPREHPRETTEPDSALVSNLATVLLQALGRTATPATSSANTSSRDCIFSRILDLSQQYLDRAETAPNVGNSSIMLLFQLLHVFGRRMQEQQAPLESNQIQRSRVVPNPLPSLQQATSQVVPPAPLQSQAHQPPANVTQNPIQAIQSLMQSSTAGQPSTTWAQALQSLMPNDTRRLAPTPQVSNTTTNEQNSNRDQLLQLQLLLNQQTSQLQQHQQQSSQPQASSSAATQIAPVQQQQQLQQLLSLMQMGQQQHQAEQRPRQQEEVPQQNNNEQECQQTGAGLQDLLVLLARAQQDKGGRGT